MHDVWPCMIHPPWQLSLPSLGSSPAILNSFWLPEWVTPLLPLSHRTGLFWLPELPCPFPSSLPSPCPFPSNSLTPTQLTCHLYFEGFPGALRLDLLLRFCLSLVSWIPPILTPGTVLLYLYAYQRLHQSDPGGQNHLTHHWIQALLGSSAQSRHLENRSWKDEFGGGGCMAGMRATLYQPMKEKVWHKAVGSVA